MLIDWFTVVAQAVNFLVLVWLLRRFLYRPISRAMAEREGGIDARLAEARQLRDDATAERERLSAEVERFAAEREDRARSLREELDATRRAQLQQARADVDELQARWREAVQREKEGFLIELRQRVGQEILAVARRALAELADESLEARVIDRFLDQLNTLDVGQREALSNAAHATDGRLHLRSAFALPAAERNRITAAAQATIEPGCDVSFEVSPALVGGIELRAGGQALGWTFDDYLTGLEHALVEAFGEEWEAGDEH